MYPRGITDEDARKIVIALEGTELGKAKGVLVLVSKDKGRTTVSVPIGGSESADENADHDAGSSETSGNHRTDPWNDPEVVKEFTAVGEQLIPALGGAFDIVLLNGDGESRRTIPIAARETNGSLFP